MPNKTVFEFLEGRTTILFTVPSRLKFTSFCRFDKFFSQFHVKSSNTYTQNAEISVSRRFRKK